MRSVWENHTRTSQQSPNPSTTKTAGTIECKLGNIKGLLLINGVIATERACHISTPRRRSSETNRPTPWSHTFPLGGRPRGRFIHLPVWTVAAAVAAVGVAAAVATLVDGGGGNVEEDDGECGGMIPCGCWWWWLCCCCC